MWNKKRLAAYDDVLKLICEHRKVTGIRAGETNQHIDPDCCPIDSVEDVQRAIECGCVEQKFYSETKPTRVEYHRWLTKMKVLGEFLSQNLFFAYENRYCDMLFSSFIQSYENLESVTYIPLEWSYFYRNAGGEYPCVTEPKDNIMEYLQIWMEQMEIPCMIDMVKKSLRESLQRNNIPIVTLYLHAIKLRKIREEKARGYDLELWKMQHFGELFKMAHKK